MQHDTERPAGMAPSNGGRHSTASDDGVIFTCKIRVYKHVNGSFDCFQLLLETGQKISPRGGTDEKSSKVKKIKPPPSIQRKNFQGPTP